MSEQQKDVQSQKPKVSPGALGGVDKEAADKSGLKNKDPKKAGMKDDDDSKDSSCGTGSCG